MSEIGGAELSKDELSQVIVVGGGLSGLSAAYRLATLGRKVTVFEKEEKLGGKCVAIKSEGFIFDGGPQCFRDSYDIMLKTAISLGLGPYLRIPVEPVGIHSRGKLSSFFPRKISALSVFPRFLVHPSRLAGFISTCLNFAGGYRKHDVRFPGRWTGISDKSAAEYLKEKIGEDFINEFAQPVVRFSLGSDLNAISVQAFHVALKMFLFDRTGYFSGGLSRLIETYANKIVCKSGISVERVIVEKGRVTGLIIREKENDKEKSLKAKNVICAIPAPEVLRVAPDVNRETREILKGIKYSPHLVVCLGLESELPPRPGFILSSIRDGLTFDYCCASASKSRDCSPAGREMVTVVFVADNAESVFSEKEETVIGRTVSLLEDMWNTILSIKSSAVRKFICGRPVINPSHSRVIADLWSYGTGIEGLYFAGDWSYAPTMEGAVMSGFLAADMTSCRFNLPFVS